MDTKAFTFAWPYPHNSIMTEEAVRGLVGKDFKLNELNGTVSRALILGAVNKPDESCVELTVRRIPKPPEEA